MKHLNLRTAILKEVKSFVMPLEIRELVIKVTVEETTAKPAAAAEQLATVKADIVKECMEKIMRKLEQTNER